MSTASRSGRKGGELTGRNPTDRGKAGTKYHLLADANGLVLHTLLSPANIHDSMLFEPLLETDPRRPRASAAFRSASSSAREAARLRPGQPPPAHQKELSIWSNAVGRGWPVHGSVTSSAVHASSAAPAIGPLSPRAAGRMGGGLLRR